MADIAGDGPGQGWESLSTAIGGDTFKSPPSILSMPCDEARPILQGLSENGRVTCQENQISPLVEAGFAETIDRVEFEKRQKALRSAVPNCQLSTPAAELLETLAQQIEKRKEEPEEDAPSRFKAIVTGLFRPSDRASHAEPPSLDELQATYDLCATLPGYVKVGYCYYRLTEKGEDLVNELVAHEGAGGELSLQAFNSKIERETAVISARLQATLSFRELLLDLGYTEASSDESIPLWECAASLALIQDDGALASRVKSLAATAFEGGYSQGCSLDIVRALAPCAGDPNSTWGRFQDQYNYLINEKEWVDAEDSLVQAALMLRLPGTTSPAERAARYDEAADAAANIGWDTGSAEACHLVVQVALCPGDYQQTCDRVLLHEGRLGWRNSFTSDTALAAFIWARAGLVPGEVEDRFNAIEDELKKKWEWAFDEGVTAQHLNLALLAVMPEDAKVLAWKAERAYKMIEPEFDGDQNIESVLLSGIEPPFDFRRVQVEEEADEVGAPEEEE